MANRSDAELWANEKLINQNYSETFQLPSDIKPGTYILRTDLLALHGNVFTDGSVEPYGGRGPQFYTHCFNIDVIGNGTATPKGVKFPGGYKQGDLGVSFQLYDQKKFPWAEYVSNPQEI
jgi:cellulase